jgi:hypothetical protein
VLLVVGYVFLKKKPDDPDEAKEKMRQSKTDSEGGALHGLDDEELQALPLSEKLELEQHESTKGKEGTQTIGEAATVASTAAPLSEEQRVQSNLGQETQPSRAEQSFAEEEKQPEDDLGVPLVKEDSASLLLAAVPYISSQRSDEPPTHAREVEFTNTEELGMHDSLSLPEVRSTGAISHESEAGWSETYTSSMGTMSDDEMLPETPALAALSQPNMVMLGATGALAGGPGASDATSADAKLEDLEKAIIAGDWVAVGATASALATMQYDNQSKSDLSRSTGGPSAMSSKLSDTRRWIGAIDEDKAAELDHMIESGDWDGIVEAASRFEAEMSGTGIHAFVGDEMDDAVEVHEDNSEDEGGSDEVYSGSNISSKFTPTSGQTEGDPPPKRSREEMRAEVLKLVKQVVPEEVDHVDEMMDQFDGRESELLETLTTMLDRAAAQQALEGAPEQRPLGVASLKTAETAAQSRNPSSSTKPGNAS